MSLLSCTAVAAGWLEHAWRQLSSSPPSFGELKRTRQGCLLATKYTVSVLLITTHDRMMELFEFVFNGGLHPVSSKISSCHEASWLILINTFKGHGALFWHTVTANVLWTVYWPCYLGRGCAHVACWPVSRPCRPSPLHRRAHAGASCIWTGWCLPGPPAKKNEWCFYRAFYGLWRLFISDILFAKVMWLYHTMRQINSGLTASSACLL